MEMNVSTLTVMAVVATLALPAAAETAKINGDDIFYETIGSGPAVMVMHGGLGLSHDYLRPYFDQLAEDHTVIYYDHLGNGRSAKPDDFAEMTFDRMVSDAEALMTHLGHESMTLIGHSYGGFIAQEFAAQKPELLDGLVLIGTVPAFDYKPTVTGTDEQMAAFGKLFSEPMADNADWQSTWAQVVQMYFKDWDANLGAALDDRTVYEYRAWNAAGPLLGTFNMLEKLPRIDTPTLVVSGRHDGIAPPEPGAERIANLMPNATLVVLENSAHYPFIEEEAAFFESLEDWLDR